MDFAKAIAIRKKLRMPFAKAEGTRKKVRMALALPKGTPTIRGACIAF
ncbi:MAG: hypothetical protein H7330_02870 [Hymenobacteraceae bacterium]|nr:hypothetical protein [Hymenobacteraceae bacterium]